MGGLVVFCNLLIMEYRSLTWQEPPPITSCLASSLWPTWFLVYSLGLEQFRFRQDNQDWERPHWFYGGCLPGDQISCPNPLGVWWFPFWCFLQWLPFLAAVWTLVGSAFFCFWISFCPRRGAPSLFIEGPMAISCGKCIPTVHVCIVMSLLFPQRSARVNARSSFLHAEVPWLKDWAHTSQS